MSRDASIETVKDLLIIGPQNTDQDESIDGQWDECIAYLSRQHDLFSDSVSIEAEVDQAIYQVPDNTTRIISVAFNKETLGHTDKATMDFRNTAWVEEESGSPKFWMHNRVQQEIDPIVKEIGPQDFMVFPPPDGASARADSIHLIHGEIPNEVPLWVEPLVTYLCVGDLAGQNPNTAETEKSEWFGQLAQLWIEVAKTRLQV